MAPSGLSGNTLGLKFMQRAAAKKAAAAANEAESNHSQSASIYGQGTNAPGSHASSSSQGSRANKGQGRESHDGDQPVASTSKLPPSVKRQGVSVEASYLAFPILSTPGLGGAVQTGRMSFGKQKASSDQHDDEDDEAYAKRQKRDANQARRQQQQKQKQEQAQADTDTDMARQDEQGRMAPYSGKGFVKPAGFDGLPAPIRNSRHRKPPQVDDDDGKEEEVEDSKVKEESGQEEEEEQGEEAEADFAEELIANARAKRKAGPALADEVKLEEDTPSQSLSLQEGNDGASEGGSVKSSRKKKKKKVKQEEGA